MNTTGNMTRVALAAVAALLAQTTPASVVAQPDAWLDYIEADGSQFIDTGVAAMTGVKARLDIAWTKASGSMVMLGTKGKIGGSSSISRFFPCYFNGGKPAFGYGKGSAVAATNGVSVKANIRLEIVCDLSSPNALQLYQNSAETLDAEQRAAFAAKGFCDMGGSLYLFAVHDLDAVKAGSFANARLYECRILRSNGVGGFDVVRHYLPCLKDGRAALYDAVNGTINYSEGETDFIAPSGTLPRPASLVSWVQSDGGDGDRRLYIDTGIFAKSGIRADIDFTLMEAPATDTATRIILGSYFSGGYGFFPAACYGPWFCYAYGTAYARCQPSEKNATPVAALAGTRYRILSDLRDGMQSATVNETQLSTNLSASATGYFTTTNHLYLFAGRSASGAGYFIKTRLHALSLWDGDELLRSFQPCVADNGRAGLYDAVTRRIFFPKAGRSGVTAGDFDPATEIGPVIGAFPEATAPLVRLGYVESDGVDDYIDLGVTARDGTIVMADAVWLKKTATDSVLVGARCASKDLDGNDDGRFLAYVCYQNAHRNAFRYFSALPADGAIETGVRYLAVSTMENYNQTINVRRRDNGVWAATCTNRSTFAGAGFDTGANLYLFACNDTRAANATVNKFAKARLYSLKIWQKDAGGNYALVRDMVPVVSPATGLPALYDKIGGRCHGNSGEGALIGGGGSGAFGTGASFSIK